MILTVILTVLKNKNEDLKMRLGGIIHSARAFWAINYDFGLGYISPTYLDTRIFDFSTHLNNPKLIKVAVVPFNKVTWKPFAF